MESPKDYHDFVIKDGKLIGKFDEMYRECDDPWIQSRRCEDLEIRFLLSMLEGKTYPRILEYGCGHGHVAESLKKFGSVLGLDISEAAIQKARDLYPDVEFDTCDMIKGIGSRTAGSQIKESFDLITISGTLWYVVEHIESIFQDVSNHLTSRGELLISLPYPPLGQNFYGKHILPDDKSLVSYVREFFKVEHFVTIHHEFKADAPIVQVLAKKA